LIDDGVLTGWLLDSGSASNWARSPPAMPAGGPWRAGRFRLQCLICARAPPRRATCCTA
jgi:hypothetical protein